MDRGGVLIGASTLAVGTALAGCLGQGAPTEPARIGSSEGARGESIASEALGKWLDAQATGDVSETERADIFSMREEERVARDVYLALADAWSLRSHDTISDSEQTHMDAILGLVEKYDLEEPATGGLGTFTNQELQALHDEPVAWGRESELASLKVGCHIEEKNMHDIQVRIDRADEDPIVTVYENLIRGSRNHLRVFYRTLTDAGGDYEPVYVSQERFDEIVNSDRERGRA
ncbi:MAG: DUF2202 domain-containing protein [Haloarculaceae archaeon]